MLIQQTDKWRSSPPIMTDPTIGLIRRPASLLADVPEHLGRWAIDRGYAVAYGDGENAAPPTPIAANADGDTASDDLILEFLNSAEPETIAAIKGIADATAAKVAKARPLTAETLATVLTPRQVQTLRQYVGGED